jgi:3-oxoacyl-(acyl-carrier-protein) synthase
MMARITGTGWVTPWGRDIAAVCGQILKGTVPDPDWPEPPAGYLPCPVRRVPPDVVADVAAWPRLRRSSAISLFAVAAASDAAAGMSPDALARTALLFVSSDGGVVYSRRFFAEIVTRGPGAGSPLLFPETVYNAPASHIAARLGLTGESLTLVGDVEAGIDALGLAAELLATGDADHCLVVGAQELDTITSEAYVRWRLSATRGRDGAVFSEGAAAVRLSREGTGPAVTVLPTTPAGDKAAATARLGDLPGRDATLVSSDSGTPSGRHEAETLRAAFPGRAIFRPKRTLGESLACASLQQVVFAAHLVENGLADKVLACATGFHCGIGAAVLTDPARHA